MGKHYPRNQVSAPHWCNECKRETEHKIWFPPKQGGGILGHCLACEKRKEEERQQRLLHEAEERELQEAQGVLFA